MNKVELRYLTIFHINIFLITGKSQYHIRHLRKKLKDKIETVKTVKTVKKEGGKCLDLIKLGQVKFVFVP